MSRPHKRAAVGDLVQATDEYVSLNDCQQLQGKVGLIVGMRVIEQLNVSLVHKEIKAQIEGQVIHLYLYTDPEWNEKYWTLL